jgi:branched-chain amino acid transport system ATP-binding protein
MTEALRVDAISAGYGEAVVLEDMSFALEAGEAMALLGRNGVGKSTLLLTLMGLTRRRAGSIHWQGRDITSRPPHERARYGIGWVPQERGMFASLTVDEHLRAVARPGHWDLKRVYALFPRLDERRRNFGNQLSGGEQQMLAIARTLMLNPSLLLLDEPMEGLAPIVIQYLIGVIRDLASQSGMTIILVEQHAKLALSLTRQVIVLDRGRIVHRSDSERLLRDPDTLHRLVAVA